MRKNSALELAYLAMGVAKPEPAHVTHRPNHEMTLFELHQLAGHLRNSYKLQKRCRDQISDSLRTADKNCAELYVTLSRLESDLRDLMIKHGMNDFSELTTLDEEQEGA